MKSQVQKINEFRQEQIDYVDNSLKEMMPKWAYYLYHKMELSWLPTLFGIKVYIIPDFTDKYANIEIFIKQYNMIRKCKTFTFPLKKGKSK